MQAPIAIVGIACHYPDASSPDELFENVLAGRRAFRGIPPERLPLEDYGSEDASDPDRTYVTEAALIEGYVFDRLKFKIVGSTYRSADLTHWLSLDVADRALTDAGFENGEGLPRARTGVLLGNTLTGEFTRAQALRLRWPYVRALLAEELSDTVPEGAERDELFARIESRFKAPFEPFGDESLAGGLSNTIAGRICNYFDLKGGGFTVDGACASSLLAVANACGALAAGELDVVLAGGVDLSLDPFELVGFARAGALARHEMRVYDERSEGFWPGEGCGFVVLMREEDAIAQGRPIRARIRGWGISSDGAGGISRPEEAGQVLALRRAYERAGFSPRTVGYFEGHGTGTVIGDGVELSALTRLLEEAEGPPPPAGSIPVGSIKANIGHTKAASGVAGLIKAALALESQLVPPTPGCDRPLEAVDPARGGRLAVPNRAEPWPAERALRAGVSSMGFGGINAHVVLDADPPARRPAIAPREARLAYSAQDAELFLFSEESAEALGWRIEGVRERAIGMSRAELSDLAAHLACELQPAQLRAAVVASRPAELAEGLAALADRLASGSTRELSPDRGIFLGAPSDTAPAIGFLFPGQGAPLHPDLGALGERFGAQVVLPGTREAAGPDDCLNAGIVQPAIVAASLAAAQLTDELGIEARVAVGHSLGEISALAWAGALEPDVAVGLAEARGRITAECGAPGGAMSSLAASPEMARILIKDLPCVIASHNGPLRCTVSGPADAIEKVHARARKAEVGATKLTVAHAFHSPGIEACAAPFRRVLARTPLGALRRKVLSTRSGVAIPSGIDLRAHLVDQLTEPVLFADAIEAAGSEIALEAVRRRVAERCELPGSAIQDEDRFLSDLHLTSIAVSALAAEAARDLGRPPLVAPNEFADATVAELAAAIDSEERVLASSLPVPGVGSWLQAFEIRDVERARPRVAASSAREGTAFRWRAFGAEDDELATEVADALRENAGVGGVVVHLSRDGDGDNLSLMLEASKAVLEELDSQLFVLVHHGDPAVAIARTLHQEGRSLATRVVEVPHEHPRAAEWVVDEARAAAGYLECR